MTKTKKTVMFGFRTGFLGLRIVDNAEWVPTIDADALLSAALRVRRPDLASVVYIQCRQNPYVHWKTVFKMWLKFTTPRELEMGKQANKRKDDEDENGVRVRVTGVANITDNSVRNIKAPIRTEEWVVANVPRELREYALLRMSGCDNRETATILEVSYHTVRKMQDDLARILYLGYVPHKREKKDKPRFGNYSFGKME